ncbi:MAG: FAD:protein FMN transferase [Prevotella sp.]|nr:FAD:protein FMN transferase [Prevotella sp.]
MTRKSLFWQLPLLILLIIGTIYIIKNEQNKPYLHTEGNIFGTTYHITYQSHEHLEAEMTDALRQVDANLSMFNGTSVISRINRGEQPVVAGTMFEEVYRQAETISRQTDGTFDITVAPLVNAWGFGFRSGNMPTREQIDSLLQFVGYTKVTLNGTLRKQDPRTMLDCSAIAKGYGCDMVAKVLNRHDVKNYMIEIGGEVVVKGVNSKGEKWHIGLQKPKEEGTEIQEIITLSDRALATSGNYRRFYYKDGRKYAHTIDPATGYPVQHNLLSATVIADDCATADAYATALMVMGLERGRAFLKKHKELSAYLIYTDEKGDYKTEHIE